MSFILIEKLRCNRILKKIQNFTQRRMLRNAKILILIEPNTRKNDDGTHKQYINREYILTSTNMNIHQLAWWISQVFPSLCVQCYGDYVQCGQKVI